MQYWRPVPQALITDTLIHRWTKDNPAPDLVGFLVAFDRLMAGTPWSARKLAVYAGWSRWRANQTLQAARDFQAEWQELNRPLFTESARPPEVSDSGQIGNQSGQKPARNQPETGHHAHAITTTPTEQEQEPNQTPMSAKTDISCVWEQMEDIRIKACTGSKRARLGKRRDDLRRRVSEHGEETILHTWRWLWESRDRRAQYLRDEGYGISTFLRAGKLRDYVDRASEWNPDEQVGGSGWFGDDDFDEHGNLVTLTTHTQEQ